MTETERFDLLVRRVSSALILLGPFLDQLSTRISLTYLTFTYEANPFTRMLMQNGWWIPFDLALVLVGLVLPYLISRRWKSGLAAYGFPFTLGLLRTVAAGWNFAIMGFYLLLGLPY